MALFFRRTDKISMKNFFQLPPFNSQKLLQLVILLSDKVSVVSNIGNL